MRMTIVAVSAMTLLACASAMAADSADGPAQAGFADLDSNADMYIDKQEFEQFHEKMRDKMRGKFPSGPPGGLKGRGDWAAQLYNDADTDGDGMLNEYEFSALQKSMRSMREKMQQRWADKGQRT